MLKIFEWFVANWKTITLIFAFIFLFALIKPITDGLRNSKEGIKEIFTPLGFLVFLVLVIVGIYIFSNFKGMI